MAIITTKKNKTPLGIYIHIPFCKSKCQYCDFYSLPGKTDELCASYIDAVTRHIKESGALAPNHIVDTIYFGGGTPSYFGAEGLAMLLTAVRRYFDVSPEAEITFEANPDSVSEALLKRLFAEGFNRVSLGIQSDKDAILEVLGRPHNYADAVQAFQKIRRAGFMNISVDLMYGLPGQTLYTWRDTLENVLKLGPEHISCYGLKIEPGTPFYEKQNQIRFPDDDAQADMYLAAVEILAQHNYRQYEISNFARRGKMSEHNLKYWTGREYLGFGPNAASDFAGKRFTIVDDLDEYIRGIREKGKVIQEVTEIPYRERAGEYVMLRMRTTMGIGREEYEHRYLLPFAPLEAILLQNQRLGLTRLEEGRWSLTPQGMLVSNIIISDLLNAQDASEPLTRRNL